MLLKNDLIVLEGFLEAYDTSDKKTFVIFGGSRPKLPVKAVNFSKNS